MSKHSRHLFWGKRPSFPKCMHGSFATNNFFVTQKLRLLPNLTMWWKISRELAFVGL